MDSRVRTTGVELIYSSEVTSEIERIISLNLSVPLDKVALFISRLLKGFQNLANSDNDFIPCWGDYLYEMEDIGMVVFQPIFDTTSDSTAFYVKSIRWNFPNSRFFYMFDY